MTRLRFALYLPASNERAIAKARTLSAGHRAHAPASLLTQVVVVARAAGWWRSIGSSTRLATASV